MNSYTDRVHAILVSEIGDNTSEWPQADRDIKMLAIKADVEVAELVEALERAEWTITSLLKLHGYEEHAINPIPTSDLAYIRRALAPYGFENVRGIFQRVHP